MRIRKTDAMAAVLLVSVVAIALGNNPPVPCEADGKNYATINQNCTTDPIRSCGTAMVPNNPATCPAFVILKQYQGNFYCYSSAAIGGQTTN